jgi:hypothetical protein
MPGPAFRVPASSSAPTAGLPARPPGAAWKISPAPVARTVSEENTLVNQPVPRSRAVRARKSVLLCAGIGAALLAGGCSDDWDFNGPPNVARIAVTGPAATVPTGQSMQLTATPLNPRDRQILGLLFNWSSSDTSIVRVDENGVVTGGDGGTATITAERRGLTGSMDITVLLPPVARLTLTPPFATVSQGATTTFSPLTVAANGDTLRGATITWSSTATGVATVDATGTVTGVAEGQARIAARSGSSADTATVAVLGPSSLLATAFVGGAPTGEVRAGQTFTVPVVLDLARVSANGDLGSVQFDLAFDPAVLEYVSAASALQGGSATNLVAPGRVRFAFAGTAPQGSAQLTLVTLTFRVAAGTAAGTHTVLDLAYTEQPTATNFSAYALPVTLDGRVRVAP